MPVVPNEPLHLDSHVRAYLRALGRKGGLANKQRYRFTPESSRRALAARRAKGVAKASPV